MSTITIRAGKPEDIPQVHRLICELAAFENALEAVQTTPEELARDAWGDKALFEYMVAESAPGEIVGMALYYKAYSTWKGPVLYLDDLVVTESCRGMGLGKRLLEQVIEKGREWGVRQVRWQVLDWNTNAIRLYEKSGAVLDPEWINCKVILG